MSFRKRVGSDDRRLGYSWKRNGKRGRFGIWMDWKEDLQDNSMRVKY